MAASEPTNRRQSGLWTQNPDTGFFDRQQQQPAVSQPYQYYQPPTSTSTSTSTSANPVRRSFSDRTGNTALSDAYIAATQNKVFGDNAGSILDKNRIKDVALATHSKIAASLHAYSGDSKSEDFARAGHAVHVHSPEAPIRKSRDLNATGPAARPALTVDPNAVPENVRSEAWSPQPTGAEAASTSANAELPQRKPSIQDRSPLQTLEGKLSHISKEEKRARMEQLEQVARQKSLSRGEGAQPARSNTLRSERGRVVSDGSRRSSDGRNYQSDRHSRQVTAGAPKALPPAENRAARFRRASESLRESSGPRDVPGGAPERQRSVRSGVPAIVNNPRPYHHAPPEPRSLGVAHPQIGAAPRIAREAQPYHHAPAEPTSVRVAAYPHNANRISRDGGSRSISNPMSLTFQSDNAPSPNDGLNRSSSGTYKRRLRDAGFAGAAAMAAGAAGYGVHEATAADRGKLAYEKRKSGGEEAYTPTSPTAPEVGRTESRKLQKPYPPSEAWQGRRSLDAAQSRRQPTGTSRSAGIGNANAVRTSGLADEDGDIPPADKDVDPVPRASVATGKDVAVPYTIPPQTAAAQDASQQVGFSGQQPQQDKHHHFGGGLFHHHDGNARSYVGAKPLEEWRTAKTARLTSADVEFDALGDEAWWDGKNDRNRRSSSGRAGVAAAQYDGPYEEEAKSFRPPLFLKCGPLLRYAGIQTETPSSGGAGREIWRGSIMVVTEDDQSDYSSPPTLRLFAQPTDLHQPPSRQAMESGQVLPPEDEDPVAGQVKISRTGRPLYVRPVHDIDGEVDLSREENNSGLYSATRAPMLGPQFSSTAEDRQSAHITFQNKSRIKGRDGEKAGRYRDVRGIRLHTERGFTFWRWSIEVELGSTAHRVAYRINRGPALGFWVPARGESMNIMFHSCNGFSLSVDSNAFSGPDPLWRDVMNRHQSRPFHVMLGGGDQIYNDAAMRDTTLFREWLQSKNPESKHHTPFSVEMQNELEEFYLNRYSMWFSQGLFAMANSQIPMVNLWDDHDIIDGFGSYPHHFQSTPVFTGIGAIAYKYYMLFQHQSLPAETSREEPSWVLGASPGPYINELSRSVFLSLGRGIAFLGLDCRTERMRDEVLSQQTYDIIFSRAREEIRRSAGQTKHLLVLLGVPIAYPRLNFLENILTSRAMDPIKALGRAGMLGGFVNKFDGGVEILDDLDDHWTAKHHKAERNWFIQELQELAAELSVRITILGGDVHLAAVGQFYTPRSHGISKDHDHRYMPNVISSAIVNTPPPSVMADVLNKRNKVHHLDHETDEDLIPMFDADVKGEKRNNKCLLPRRNFCSIRQYAPSGTPPGSPRPGPADERGRAFPPGSMMTRTMSLGGGAAGRLVRRLSGSRGSGRMERSSSLSGIPGSMGSPQQQPEQRASLDNAAPRPGMLRRPTDLSIRRAARKGGAPEDDDAGHVDLEGGLDVCLHVEVDQKDPSGATVGYRLLVPALWYEGSGDLDTAVLEKKSKGGFLGRLMSKRRKPDEDDRSIDDDTDSQAPSIQDQDHQGEGAMAYDGPGHGRQSLDAPPRTSAGAAAGAGAYKPPSRGFEPPPLGSHAPRPQQTQQSAPLQSHPPAPTNTRALNNPYPSVPVSQKHSQQPPPGLYDGGEGYDSEGSLTGSEGMLEEERRPRRLSKADRVLGMGERGNEYEGEKRKARWMIWK